MRVFCGYDRRQSEAGEVFKTSVVGHWFLGRSRDGSKTPLPSFWVDAVSADLGTCKRRGVTAFSYARFMVPHLCGYEGRAVFFDGADMLCLGDVKELADLDMGDHAVMVVKHGWERGPVYPRPRSWTSVMLLDCARLKCWTPEVVETADDAQLMRFGAFPEVAIGELPPEWNVLVQPGSEPPAGAKIAHWSALSDPEGGSWIDRSGSAVWAAARDHYLERAA